MAAVSRIQPEEMAFSLICGLGVHRQVYHNGEQIVIVEIPRN